MQCVADATHFLYVIHYAALSLTQKLNFVYNLKLNDYS